MYVCGTNAFDPKCDHMVRPSQSRQAVLLSCEMWAKWPSVTLATLPVQSYVDGKLILEKNMEDGRGRCPFDPFQRYAFIMDGESAPRKNKMSVKLDAAR